LLTSKTEELKAGPFFWLLLLLFTAACDLSTEPKTAAPIRVGAAVSLSGSLSVEGTDTRRGYELWADWVNNERKGVLVDGVRRNVELIIRDDASDATRSAQLVQELIDRDSVDFLLGPYGSAATLTTSAVAEAKGIIIIDTNGASDEIFSRGFQNTFGVLTPGREYTKAAMQSLAALGARTVVLAQEAGGAFSISVANGAAHWAQVYGLQVLATFNYPRAATDLSAVIDQAKALAPDAFIGGGYLNDAVLFTRTAAQRGFRPKAMLLTVGPGGPEFTAALRDTANLILGPTQWERSMTWQGVYLGTPAQYAQRYAAKFGSQPSYQSAQSTAGGIVLMHAIESANSLNTAAVRTALRSMDLMTFYGPVRFDATGKNIAKPMSVVQIQAGQTVVVAPQEAAVATWVYPQ
jgi:branched-chain amino acid transport system substrate-binding protein